jgi:hypothetical protein
LEEIDKVRFELCVKLNRHQPKLNFQILSVSHFIEIFLVVSDMKHGRTDTISVLCVHFILLVCRTQNNSGVICSTTGSYLSLLVILCFENL